ncbi:hypothetical protein C2S52_019218 [Perilla frutescens var. hirtella]|nr:hypothetical protein C2S52_019218 [Perilla frutescens var. hirtella]
MADQHTSAVYLAMLTEGIKRCDEMVEAIKIVTSMNLELTEKERKLLTVGYKNMFGARVTALKTLASIEGEELNKGNREKATSALDHVLYNKMIGDAYRYCAEFKTGEDQDNLAKHSLTSYLCTQSCKGVCRCSFD